MRRSLRCWLWRTWRRRLSVRIGVGVGVKWRLGRREEITPKNQYRRRGDQGQNKSLLLLHSILFGVRRLVAAFPFGLCDAKAVTSHRTPKSLHRIISAGMKWMTAQEPPQPHPASAQRTVPFNRFPRIFRTRGNKTTRLRQPGRDRGFVKLQKRNKNDAHRLQSCSVPSPSGRGLGRGSKRARPTLTLSLTPALSQRERELTLAFGLAYLSNQSTKLAEPKFFVCGQQ